MQPINPAQQGPISDLLIQIDEGNCVFDRIMEEHNISTIPCLCIYSNGVFVRSVHPLDEHVRSVLS